MKATCFIILEPGKIPRMGYPGKDVVASLKQWIEHHPNADILVLTTPDGKFPTPGTGWVESAQEYLQGYDCEWDDSGDGLY